jgi:hypothetical protein
MKIYWEESSHIPAQKSYCNDNSMRELCAAIVGKICRAMCLCLPLFAILLGVLVNVGRAQTAANNPVIEGVSFREVSFANNVVTFTVEITGNNFGGNPSDLTAVEFMDAKGTAVGTIKSKLLASNNKIVVQAEVPLGTTINVIRITTRGIPVETSSFKLSLKEPTPAPKIIPFEIKHSTISSTGSPLQTLFITNDKGLFSSNANRMNVEIIPAGASNAFIRPGSNPFNLIVDFIAPDKFEVKDVVVTVYDSSDLDSRQTIAISQPFTEKKPPTDPNQPTITKIDVLYLQRNKGIGRLKIEGSGFGNYRRPPIVADEFLAAYGRRSILPDPPDSLPEPPNTWKQWNEEVERFVNVVLVPRNTSLRVERSKILYIDDKLIDLYFEFSQIDGYSLAFRPVSVSLTVKKPGVKQLPVLKAPGVNATIEGPETYIVSKEVGPKRDENLTYEFTILDNDKANYEFGSGISKNFYVVKLSVVNRGEKKISIPLASIQAEVDWAQGSFDQDREFLEGPETQTPAPLEDVSAFFDAYQKQHGKRAQVFNTLSGLTTLGAALIPFVGPSFKDAHVVFTGGFIPGLRQAVGDLSGQQLQNLTGRSWQNVEVIPDHGGSITKYVFIQRGEQVFTGPVKPNVRKLIMNLRGFEVTGFEVIESTPKQATKQ